jgi:hypothetical protein
MRIFAQKPKTPQLASSAKSTIPGRTHVGQSHEVNSILQLQGTIWNQAVQRLVEANMEDVKGDGSITSEIPCFGHDFSRIRIHSPRQAAVQPGRLPRAQSISPVAAKGETLGDEELFTSLKGEPGVAREREFATKGESAKTVKKTELGAPTAGECGAYSWRVRFNVENAVATTKALGSDQDNILISI